jgi:hypothetical protein
MTKMRIALALLATCLLAISLSAGCRAPLEGAPCPCLPGYECVQMVCVTGSGATGDDASPIDDAGGGGLPDSSPGEPDAGPGGAPDAQTGEPDASTGTADAATGDAG